jgi:hypothetical protein
LEPSPGVLAHLRQRIIVVSTMERDVRITFIAGSTMVIVAVLLNIFRDYLGPSITTLVGTLPLGVVAVLSLGEFIVLFFISLSILLLKGRWRFIAHGLTLVLFALFAVLNGFDVASLVLLVPMAMLWMFTYLGGRQGWYQREYVLGALSTSLAAMLIFLFYVITGQQALIVEALAWQALLAMLGLCMAATDIAELAFISVESVTARLARFSSYVPIAIILALLAITGEILLTLMVSDSSSRSIASTLGSGVGLAMWLALIYWMVIVRRKKLGSVHPHLEYWVLLLIVSFYFLAFQAGIGLRLISDPLTFRASEIFTYPKVFIFTTLGEIAFLAAFLIAARRSARLFVSLTYGFTVGMFIFHYYSTGGEGIVQIVDGVAMGSLLYLALAALSRKVRQNYEQICWIVADLNIAFLGYALIAALFFGLGGHGHEGFTAGQALIILLALAWDLVSSGETITNHHSESFPRLARAATFIAYIVSVALLVMVSTAGHFVLPLRGEAVENVFNSEALVAVGLVMFGAPFIFSMSILRLRNVLVAADAEPHLASEAKIATTQSP